MSVQYIKSVAELSFVNDDGYINFVLHSEKSRFLYRRRRNLELQLE